MSTVLTAILGAVYSSVASLSSLPPENKPEAVLAPAPIPPLLATLKFANADQEVPLKVSTRATLAAPGVSPPKTNPEVELPAAP